MAENAPQMTAIGTQDDPTRGLPYHDKLTQDLKILLQRKRVLDRNITAIEDSIYKREGDYMDDTPHGNILSGFDNYIKGTSGSAPLGRRKQGITDADRIFSRSSTRFNDAIDSPGPLSAQTTPSAAPTPANSSFPKGDASNVATPTSATSANKSGAGQKKVKRNGDDSETDTKDAKKARTNFGASRK